MGEAEKLRAEMQLAMFRAVNLGFAGGAQADAYANGLRRAAFANEQ